MKYVDNVVLTYLTLRQRATCETVLPFWVGGPWPPVHIAATASMQSVVGALSSTDRLQGVWLAAIVKCCARLAGVGDHICIIVVRRAIVIGGVFAVRPN